MAVSFTIVWIARAAGEDEIVVDEERPSVWKPGEAAQVRHLELNQKICTRGKLVWTGSQMTQAPGSEHFCPRSTFPPRGHMQCT